MKTVLVVVGALILLVTLSFVSRGCDTASKMADKTVFNADKHVYSYEEFHRKFEQYERYKQQLADAKEELAKLEAGGVKDGQRYDNLATEATGCRQMMKRIAAEYNAMSKIAYQGVWRSKGLPEKLE